jgi:hypothetical protein
MKAKRQLVVRSRALDDGCPRIVPHGPTIDSDLKTGAQAKRAVIEFVKATLAPHATS